MKVRKLVVVALGSRIHTFNRNAVLPQLEDGIVVACRQMWIAKAQLIYFTGVRLYCVNILEF